MFFLLTQIFICLLIAAILGALAAWFLRRRIAQRRETAIQQGWKDQMRQVELDRDRSIHTLAAEIEKLKNPKAGADSGSDTDAKDYDYLVTNLQGQIAEREEAITDLRNEVQSIRSELTEARNTSVQLETELLLKNEQDQQREPAVDDAALSELKEKLRSRDETIKALRDAQAKQDQEREPAVDDAALSELKEKLRSRDETIKVLRDAQAKQDQKREPAVDDAALSELKETLRSRDETIRALRDAQARQSQQREQTADNAALSELKETLRSRDKTIAALRDDLSQKNQRDEKQRGEHDKQLRSAMDEAIVWQEKYEKAAERLAQRKTAGVVEGSEPADDLLSYSEPTTGSGAEKRERVASDRIGSVLSHPGGHKDKLQEIKGIGPVLERKLNDFGIYHFKQIAEFTAEDIVRVSNELGKFASRMQRDEWVSQAQSLHRKYHQQNS